MGASAGEDWDSFIDRMCRLETENAELKEINKEMQGALDHLCIVAHKVCDDFCCGAGCYSDATDCHLEAGLIRAEIALRKARGEGE